MTDHGCAGGARQSFGSGTQTDAKIASAAAWRRSTIERARSGRAVVLLGLLAAVCAWPAAAEDFVSDEWQFKVTPYLWAISVDGHTTVKGQKSDVDMSFSDIVKDLNFGFFGQGEVRKGRFGVMVDGMYSALSSNANAGPLKIDADVDLVYVGAAAYYRLGPWNLDARRGDAGPKLVVDPYAGARYTYAGVDLKLNPPVSGNRKLNGSQDWVDPIIGVRTILQLTPKWSLTALGDVGGFGVGSDLAWQAAGVVGYRFGLFSDRDNAQVIAGYRALYQDYDNGSGTDRFEWDVTLQGPLLGLSINF
jgi:hypothetical protein